MKFIPGSNKVEKFFAKYGIAFTLVVMYQGLFGHMSLKNPPEKLQKLSDNFIFRFVTLFAIAFSVTRDVEISLLSVIMFMGIINLLRTPEERKRGLTI